MANELIIKRLEGIRDMLIALYQSSDKILSNQHSSITGPEREIFVSHFLGQILPPHYRIGGGVITDAQGAKSTQLDVVIELPFAPSFSFLDGMPRIYLADTIGAVIEVKSKLMDNVEEKFITGRSSEDVDGYTALRQIKRSVIVTNVDEGLTIKPSYTIPAYVVGYMGFDDEETIVGHIRKLNRTSQDDELNIVRGILQLGYKGNDSKIKPKTLFVGSNLATWEGGSALGAFVNSLHWELHRTSPLSWPNLHAYFEPDNVTENK